MLFQRQKTKITSHAAESGTEEKSAISTCTQNQSCCSLPLPLPHKHIHVEPERSCVDAPYRKWLSFKFLQLKLPVLSTYLLPLYVQKPMLNSRLGSVGFWTLASNSLAWHFHSKIINLFPLQFLMFSVWLCLCRVDKLFLFCNSTKWKCEILENFETNLRIHKSVLIGKV